MGCVNGAWRVFYTFFIAQDWILRIILNTGKKTRHRAVELCGKAGRNQSHYQGRRWSQAVPLQDLSGSVLESLYG